MIEMKTRILIGICVMLLSIFVGTASAQPDVSWSKTFGGSNDDLGYSINPTSDSGYIIAGYTIGVRLRCH